MRINNLKATIADAKIIDESKINTDSVQILNKVEMRNVKNGMKMVYTVFPANQPERRKDFREHSDRSRSAWQESG